jgi:hypothetical protein
MRTFRNPLGVLAIVLVALAFAAPKSMAKKNGSQQEYNDGVTALIAVWYFSLRLPLKSFFRFTSIFVFVMAVSFLGSGI